MLGVTFGYLLLVLVLVVDIDNRIKAVHDACGPSHTLLYACETWTMYHRYIKCLENPSTQLAVKRQQSGPVLNVSPQLTYCNITPIWRATC